MLDVVALQGVERKNQANGHSAQPIEAGNARRRFND
jgi:hypothetical protein